MWRRVIAVLIVLFLNMLVGTVLDEFGLGNVLMWSIHVAVAITSLIVLARLLRKINRLNRGLCYRCGYDLRATPDRCPECGAVPGTE